MNLFLDCDKSFYFFVGKSSFMTDLIQNRFDLVENCPAQIYLFFNGYIQEKYKPFIRSGEVIAHEVSIVFFNFFMERIK